jgi:hypothetical protein
VGRDAGGHHARDGRALAMASFAKAGSLIFLGAPRTQAAATRTKWQGMRGPMLTLAGVCVVIAWRRFYSGRWPRARWEAGVRRGRQRKRPGCWSR